MLKWMGPVWVQVVAVFSASFLATVTARTAVLSATRSLESPAVATTHATLVPAAAGATPVTRTGGEPTETAAVKAALTTVLTGEHASKLAAPAAKKPAPQPRIVAVDRRIAERTEMLLPEVKQRLPKVTRKLPKGVTLLVTSAYRTPEEQAALHPTFGVKAKPGTSTHEHGRGIDVNILVDGEWVHPRKQQRVIGPAMASAGFRHLGPSDPVHYSIPERELDSPPAEEPVLDIPALDELTEPVATE